MIHRIVKLLPVSAVILLMVMQACYDERVCDIPPPEFVVLLLNEGRENLLNTGQLPADFRLFYSKDGREEDVSYQVDNDPEAGYVITSRDVSWLSTQGYKTFYLHAASQTDTLFVDVESVSNDGCGSFVTQQVLFNGQKPSQTGSSGIYILQKKSQQQSSIKKVQAFVPEPGELNN